MVCVLLIVWQLLQIPVCWYVVSLPGTAVESCGLLVHVIFYISETDPGVERYTTKSPFYIRMEIC